MGKGEGERTLNWSSGSLLLLTLVCCVSWGKALTSPNLSFSWFPLSRLISPTLSAFESLTL